MCHETFDEKSKDNPSLLAFINFKGTVGGLFHWLGEIEPTKCQIGMPVEAVLKPKKERKGSILDIKYFRPL